MKEQIESNKLDDIGSMLDENWHLKAQITKGISDPQVDLGIEKGLKRSTWRKNSWCRNGGFLIFYAHKKDMINKVFFMNSDLLSFILIVQELKLFLST